MSRRNVIQTRNLSRVYNMGHREVYALRDVNLDISEGTFLAIEGTSGSGKSTLLNLIGCIDRPTEGDIIFDGENISGKRDSYLSRLRLRKIGFIFQQFYLIPTLRAVENVILPMKEAGLGRVQRKERARELLEMVGLADRERHFPNQLSGGEQQRVAIARALANEPKVILADEPTGELDSGTSGTIAELLLRLNHENRVTVVVATHDNEMASKASRHIFLRDGRIVRQVM